MNTVCNLILDGWTETRIVPQITQEWRIKRRQAYNYIAKAKRQIQQDYAEHRERALAEHLMERRRLRRESTDPLFKLTVLQDEAKLLGLYAADKHEITGAGGGAVEVILNWGDDTDTDDTPETA